MPASRNRIYRHADRDPRTSLPRRVGLVALAIALFLTSGAAFALRDLQSKVHSVDLAALLGSDRPQNDASDSYKGRAVNILVLGSDTRSGKNNVDNSQGSDEVAVARSDTAMVMHLSADRSRVDVVSIPRDTLVSIPSCVLPDGTSSAPLDDTMFNQAFAIGAGTGSDTAAIARGAACSIKTVEAMTGLFINEFVVVDFSGLERMVDALGGVGVYVTEAIDDPEYTGTKLEVGCHHLSGAEALQYARVRHGVGNGSDTGRIGRQQNLMSAMIRTALSKNLLTNLDDLYSFASAGLSTLTVSKGIGTLSTLGGLAKSVSDVGMDKINFVAMPTTEAAWDRNRLVPTSEATRVWKALKKDEAVPASTVAVSGDGTVNTPTTPDPQGTGTPEATASPTPEAPAQPPAAEAPAAPTAEASKSASNPAAQCK
ncbi:Regulatory protein msrR [Actinomyces bovis]|uniref:Regulatory protein msrR n=1 Tax=Actinomyces bovis TaxID=1658 RepID=A0ABY1VNM7_9ACTO|nr:LCP family protein [Actinomyces bovis]SPT53286.1 Regulatory protein msrR [Actinomyces bovis]VEG52586.1 Regulatory protein msrR [Actinomyces israelii]